MSLAKALAGISGWLLSYTYFFIALWNLDNASCIVNRFEGTDGIWAVSLIGGVSVLALSMLLIKIGRDHALWMRWMALPHVLTILYGLLVVYSYFSYVTIEGVHICDLYHYGHISTIEKADFWHRLFAPIHLFAILALLFFIRWFWKQGNRRVVT